MGAARGGRNSTAQGLAPAGHRRGRVFGGALLIGFLCLGAAPLSALQVERGHIKGRGELSRFPGDSLYRDLVGARAPTGSGAFRLNTRAKGSAIGFVAHYQLLAVAGDRVEVASAFPDPALAAPVLPLDQLRWLDLSQRLHRGEAEDVVQRLDRLHLTWTGERAVLRIGRQALSWGNGLFYNPMDFFNPFDPAAIDTEYKTGDDMLYGQYLLDSGSDWQAVAVQRRDAGGKAGADARSFAIKYHGFAATREFDLLLAQHFDQRMVGIGGSSNLGDAVLRADLVLTDGLDDWESSAVVNTSWSWIAWGHNMSGSLEYFFNGFGLRESEYGAAGFLNAADLVARLRRGELFTVGRHYLASSIGIELHPLLTATPTLFWNLDDRSALAQLNLSWDLAENTRLLAAVSLPVGSGGSEFGGLELPLRPPRNRLSPGPSAILQLAFYF